MQLYLYGSGKRCEILLKFIKYTPYKVCGIIDSNPAKWGTEIDGIFISSPQELIEHNEALVCVTFYSTIVHEPIWDVLEQKYRIKRYNLLSFYDIMIEAYRNIARIDKVGLCNRNHRIFFDGSWGLGLGGVESWLKDIMRLFVEYDISNCFLLTHLDGTTIPDCIQNRVLDFSIAESGVYTPKEVQKAIDFVICNMPCTIVLSRIDEVMLAAFLVKENYPEQVRIIMVDHGSCDGMYRDILSFKSMIDKYVCVSSGIKKELIKRGVAEEIVHTMTAPMPYEDNLIRKYSTEFSKPLKLGYAGRLEVFEKRMDILLKLIMRLEYKHVKYVFNIAGSGSYEAMIQRFVYDNALDNRVRLIGNVERDKISSFWEKQDIAINVSDNEGRPISNMEAMLSGAVPVVTMTVGATEDVADGRNGYVVPICDYESMAEKIKYIELHRDVLCKLGTQAYIDMKKKINPKQYVSMWCKLLYE